MSGKVDALGRIADALERRNADIVDLFPIIDLMADNARRIAAMVNDGGAMTCYNESESGFLCSSCSFGDFGGFHGYVPNYCPNCGAKVVDE